MAWVQRSVQGICARVGVAQGLLSDLAQQTLLSAAPCSSCCWKQGRVARGPCRKGQGLQVPCPRPDVRRQASAKPCGMQAQRSGGCLAKLQLCKPM